MPQPDDPGAADLTRFSGEPFTPAERRRFRRDMEKFERVKPLLDTYEKSKTITRFFFIVGTWLFGASAGLLGVLMTLKGLMWWPFK